MGFQTFFEFGQRRGLEGVWGRVAEWGGELERAWPSTQTKLKPHECTLDLVLSTDIANTKFRTAVTKVPRSFLLGLALRRRAPQYLGDVR